MSPGEGRRWTSRGRGCEAPSVVRRAVPTLLALFGLAAPREVGAWCRTTAVAQSDPARCVTDARPLSWGVRCISLRLNEIELPEGTSGTQVQGLVNEALESWSGVRCEGARPSVDLALAGSTSLGPGYVPEGPNTNVVRFRRDWREAGLPPSALALTTLTFGATTGEIKDADLLLNLSVPLSVDGQGSNDLPTILVHEVGHVLGIDHSNERTAVMWFGAGRGELRRTLHPDDRAALCAIHPPTLVRPCTRPPPESGCGCVTLPSPSSATGVLVLGAIPVLRRGRRRRADTRRC